jgi:hypothetical protein
MSCLCGCLSDRIETKEGALCVCLEYFLTIFCNNNNVYVGIIFRTLRLFSTCKNEKKLRDWLDFSYHGDIFFLGGGASVLYGSVWYYIEWRWKELFVSQTRFNEEGSLFCVLPTLTYGRWDFVDFVYRWWFSLQCPARTSVSSWWM